jgi:hypothetical protein
VVEGAFIDVIFPLKPEEKDPHRPSIRMNGGSSESFFVPNYGLTPAKGQRFPQVSHVSPNIFGGHVFGMRRLLGVFHPSPAELAKFLNIIFTGLLGEAVRPAGVDPFIQ